MSVLFSLTGLFVDGKVLSDVQAAVAKWRRKQSDIELEVKVTGGVPRHPSVSPYWKVTCSKGAGKLTPVSINHLGASLRDEMNTPVHSRYLRKKTFPKKETTVADSQ